MKKYLCWLAVVLAVPLALLGICMILLIQSGEFCNLDTVAFQTAAGEDLRFEQNYQGNTSAVLKAKVTALRGASFLVVGTSRTMQFSSQMFPDADFYNAGGAVSALGQVLPFLQSLPEDKLPDTLLIGLDQYFFNENWAAGIDTDGIYAPTVSRRDLWDALPQFLHHCGDGKIDFFTLAFAGKNVYGVPARVRGSGFVSDGSYRYGTQASDKNVDLKFTDSMQRIARGDDRFQPGDAVYEEALQRLTLLCNWCSDHDIQPVGFLPPYAPSVLQAMNDSGKYGYMSQIYPNILEIFDNCGGECYDFTDMSDTVDAEYIDGFHPGDQVYCYMIMQMLQQNSCLSQYTDSNILSQLLSQSENPRVIGYS